MQAARQKRSRATFRPTRHPPMSEGKLFDLVLRASCKPPLPLFHPQDARVGDDAQPDSHLPQYLPGEVEQLQKLGYDGQWIGGVFFVTKILEQDQDGGLRLFEEKPTHEGRHRTEAERERATGEEFKRREAERKRAARRRQKGGAA